MFFASLLAVIPRLSSIELFSALTCDEEEQYCVAWPEALLPNGVSALGGGASVETPKDCIDRVTQCEFFASSGECSLNPGWMIVNCPVSCNSCHLRDSKIRCQRDALNITNSKAYPTRTLETVFSSLKSRLEASNRFGPVKILSNSPWIVMVDDFVSSDECSDLIAGITSWERSTDAGEMNDFGESARVPTFGRTSSNGWCRGTCEKRHNVINLGNRISHYVQVPISNFEAFQVLRYEVGQQYITHHDYSTSQRDMACGPRIITALLYLSNVEEGGETVFPDLGINIKPKKGRAVFFPDVLSNDLFSPDLRVSHKAKPVLKGQKYAVNTWIHLYDFKIPNLWGCTGLFDVL